jgi:Ca2+:H+ antiporter
MGKEMSLFFSLFETISLFVSAFIINFLILDGRSNYLEGALLIAAYVIIAVGAWFYPTAKEQSPIGGAPDGPDASRMLMARGLTMLTGWQFE